MCEGYIVGVARRPLALLTGVPFTVSLRPLALLADSMIFIHPVDSSIAPDYYHIIKEPMDLTTIEENIRSGQYKTAWGYLRHMHLMIDNALFFNKPGTFVNKYAQRIQKFWVSRAEEMMMTTLSSHNYCCGRRRRLSGHSYRCRGATCFVKYGCVYWFYDPEDDEDAIVYCQSHYQKLAQEVVIPRFGNGTGGDIKFDKSKLLRTKHNTPLVEEKFVTCKRCGQEDHEICKQHLSFLGKDYYCDRCREATGTPEPPIQSPRDLAHCALSTFLEREVSSKVPLVGQRVCIRVTNAEDTATPLKPLMRERYPDHPTEFPYVQKVLLCFMDIEGRPICFFGMIVHECASGTPQPNQDRVYISLLDSIKLPKTMLPSMYRTAIYHAVVRGYLRYVGQRGFRYAHLYTCPPRKGQNYILPFKPDDQKEISTVRLRKWYSDLLTAAQNSNPPALNSFKNIGEVFKNAKLTEIPYFDGDNWPDIMEDILKFDNAQKDEERSHREIRENIEVKQLAIWNEADACRSEHIKPKCTIVNNIHTYEGLPLPRPRKRRKSEAATRPPKPKYTLQERLNVVIAQLKRDFLVVEVSGTGCFVSVALSCTLE